ncbi:hypothetical protein GW17_00025538, partial [Ensete ventricosum]
SNIYFNPNLLIWDYVVDILSLPLSSPPSLHFATLSLLLLFAAVTAVVGLHCNHWSSLQSLVFSAVAGLHHCRCSSPSSLLPLAVVAVAPLALGQVSSLRHFYYSPLPTFALGQRLASSLLISTVNLLSTVYC